MYIAIQHGQVFIGVSHYHRPTTTISTIPNGSASRDCHVKPACTSNWSNIKQSSLYAPMISTASGPRAFVGFQARGGRLAAFACSSTADSYDSDVEALGMLVVAYLEQGHLSATYSGHEEYMGDPARQFLRAVALEVLFRVTDSDLLLGSIGGNKCGLLVAHLRQGHVAGIQDISPYLARDGFQGGSILMRAPATLKSDLDQVIMSSLSEEADVSTVCSKMLSILSSQTARDNDSHFWFYATAVVELAHMNMSFAERYWDVSVSGFRQKIVSFPLTTCRDEEGVSTKYAVLAAALETGVVGVLPSTSASKMPPSLSTAKPSKPVKYPTMPQSHTAYACFVRQEAEHVPAFHDFWSNTSKLWSVRWKTMTSSERELYQVQAMVENMSAKK